MEILIEFEKYLKENYDVDGEQNTIKSYLSDIKQFILFFKDYYGEDIVDFSKAHVIEYKKYLIEERNRKFTTVNRKLASLSIYENFLIESGIRKDESKVIKKRDFYKIERPIITADMLPRKTIKKVSLKAGEMSKREYAMFTIFNNGGLRVSELINLQLDRDIDFNMYSIRILGKGKKIRTVYMDNAIYEAIMDYLPEREKMLKELINIYLLVIKLQIPINQSAEQQ